MKATIIRPDGTRIEAEGTPEEIARASAATDPPPSWMVCTCNAAATTAPVCQIHSDFGWNDLRRYRNAAAVLPRGYVWHQS